MIEKVIGIDLGATNIRGAVVHEKNIQALLHNAYTAMVLKKKC